MVARVRPEFATQRWGSVGLARFDEKSASRRSRRALRDTGNPAPASTGLKPRCWIHALRLLLWATPPKAIGPRAAPSGGFPVPPGAAPAGAPSAARALRLECAPIGAPYAMFWGRGTGSPRARGVGERLARGDVAPPSLTPHRLRRRRLFGSHASAPQGGHFRVGVLPTRDTRPELFGAQSPIGVCTDWGLARTSAAAW